MKAENKMCNKISLRNAFTLAEVLVTLGVVGIIAALTIPQLMTATNYKETVTSVKEAYSILSQAYKMTEKDYGDASHWYLNDNVADAINLLKPNLKVLNDCTDKSAGCLPTALEGLGSGSWTADGQYPALILSNGMSLTASTHNADCDSNFGDSISLQHVCQYFVVDTNGLKGPNTHGRDLFGFYLTQYGFIPTGGGMQTSDYDFSNNCINNNSTGLGCTAWVIANENLDYIKCPNDIGWTSGKLTKCP